MSTHRLSPENSTSPANAAPVVLRRMGSVSLAVLLALGAAGLMRAGQTSSDAKSADSESHGVDMTILDKTCKPCEDFYHYASGAWLAKNPVPPAYPSWG
ncbi:MAG: hypothetical protein ACRD4Y_12900, partial [Candidatus Acidiferrales bacterium]